MSRHLNVAGAGRSLKLSRFAPSDITGIRFALNVFIGATILWFLLKDVSDSNPVWAIASMIAASDPQVKEAARMFRARLINVLVGCGVGLFFMLLGGHRDWKLPLALAVTVLISSYLVKITTMWRQAPITAAIVISSGIVHQSKMTGIEHGLHKVAEVLLGCLMGLAVSYFMSRIWHIPEAAKKPAT